MISISLMAGMIFHIFFVFSTVAAHMQEANQCLKLQCYRLRTCYYR
jgi:hypothetical protein